MSMTRIFDDPERQSIKNQQLTDQGRWMIDVPGNGANPSFILDPQIISQKWGGNLWTHSVDIQSSLLGIDKYVNRDCLEPEKYKKQTVYASPIDYPVCDNFLTTEQSRSIMPAWTARDLPQNHAYILPNNPQSHTEMPFEQNIQTRVLEKDYYKRNKKYDCIPVTNNTYTVPVQIQKGTYVGGTSLCRNDCHQINNM